MPDRTINTIEDVYDYLQKMNIRQALDGTAEIKGESDFTEVRLLWTDPQQKNVKKSIVACEFPAAEYWHLEVNGWKDKKGQRLWEHKEIVNAPSLSPANLSRAFDIVARWSERDLRRKATYREPRTFFTTVPEV